MINALTTLGVFLGEIAPLRILTTNSTQWIAEHGANLFSALTLPHFSNINVLGVVLLLIEGWSAMLLLIGILICISLILLLINLISRKNTNEVPTPANGMLTPQFITDTPTGNEKPLAPPSDNVVVVPQPPTPPQTATIAHANVPREPQPPASSPAVSVLKVAQTQLRQHHRAMLEGYGLTNREMEVMLYVSEGYTNADIAAELHLSQSTVKSHCANAWAKLGIADRRELLAKLREKSL